LAPPHNKDDAEMNDWLWSSVDKAAAAKELQQQIEDQPALTKKDMEEVSKMIEEMNMKPDQILIAKEVWDEIMTYTYYYDILKGCPPGTQLEFRFVWREVVQNHTSTV